MIDHDFQAVVPAGANVYNAYAHWLGLSVSNNTSNKIDNASVLIFPDARLKKKAISPAHIQRIVNSESNQNKQIKIARFNNTNKAELSACTYCSVVSNATFNCI
jgi:hypothetical protein